MVVGRSTSLLNKFLALKFFPKLNFELSVISIGASCRMHRVSCRMRNFQNRWDQGLGKDKGDGGVKYQGCMQPAHVLFFLCDFPALCNLFKRRQVVFCFFFSFFSFFCETAGVPPGGFHPYFLPSAPPRGFHPGIFYYFSVFSFFFFLFFHFLLTQRVGGVEVKTCFTTNTVFLRFPMNSCLERGFLQIFNLCPLTRMGMASSSMVQIRTEPLSLHFSTVYDPNHLVLSSPLKLLYLESYSSAQSPCWNFFL